METQANKTRTDLAATFDKKRHLFEEKRLTFTPLGENQPPQTEEQKDIQTTVAKELRWLQNHLTKALDVSYQVAEANTVARADVVLEDDAGTLLVRNLPATSLLELEKRITEIGELIKAIPTLDPAKSFQVDPARPDGIYIAREITKSRTKKTKKAYTKYEPRVELPNLPAQVELIDEDVPIGTIREQEWSGLITPADKAELINRVEMVFRAVRRARAKANEVEVDQTKKIATPLLNFIFGTSK